MRKRRAEELGRKHEQTFAKYERQIGNFVLTRSNSFQEGYLAACADAEKLVSALEKIEHTIISAYAGDQSPSEIAGKALREWEE